MAKKIVNDQVSYSALVKQLAASQAENAALMNAQAALVAAAAMNERAPLAGTFTANANATAGTLTIEFIVKPATVVALKTPSPKQGTRACYTQPLGGVKVVLDANSDRAFRAIYGCADIRLTGNMGVR